MTAAAITYPSLTPAHRHSDMGVHMLGSVLILIGGAFLIAGAWHALGGWMVVAAIIYAISAMASNLASWAYHFLPWHDRRTVLRRIDHAAIYSSISGTFTPFFIYAATTWTMTLLVLSWGLTVIAIWNKITNSTVKSRWSTASYLGLGAIGLAAMPDLKGVPIETLWLIVGGAGAYVIGTIFYARKAMPYRYAIWHLWVTIGGVLMYAGIWMALFSGG